MFKCFTLFKLVNLMTVVTFCWYVSLENKILDCYIFLMFSRQLNKCASFKKLILSNCFQWRNVSVGCYQNRDNECNAWFLKLHACVICVYSYHDCVFSYSNYTGDQPRKYLLCSFACIITTMHVQPRQLQVPLINITDYKLLK